MREGTFPGFGRGLHERLAQSDETLRAGVVHCHRCGARRTVDAARCLAHGWPTCCGETMSLDTVEERATRRGVRAPR